MKLHCARSICRAPNRFSPSLALYQHYVVQYNVAHQQRSSSSAPAPDQISPVIPRKVSTDVPVGATTGTPRKRQGARKGREPPNSSLYRSARISKAEKDNVEAILLRSRNAFGENKQYEGVVVQPSRSSVFVPESKYPWTEKAFGPRAANGMARLNQEIHDFHEYAKPSRYESFVRKNLVDQVRNDVRTRFPDFVLEVFGSERTGIALAGSDIDLRMARREDIEVDDLAKPPEPEKRRELIIALHALYKKVFLKKASSKNSNYLLPTLRNARYPLIDLLDRNSGLTVQIVLSNSTSKARAIMQRYMAEYPYLRQVHAVVRTMFDQRGLSDVFRGGFASYSLFMMIVASLQNEPNQRGDAAGALVNFLYYWAYFETRKHGVSLDPSEYFDKKENPVVNDKVRSKIAEGLQAPHPDWMLCLRDPADPTNDLGRKGSCILHVQATLKQLIKDTIKDIDINKRPSLLAPLVGDVYARDRSLRVILEDYGRSLESKLQNPLPATAKDVGAGVHKASKNPAASGKNEPKTQQEAAADAAEPASEAAANNEQHDEDVHGFLEAETSKAPPQKPFPSMLPLITYYRNDDSPSMRTDKGKGPRL